MAHSTVTDNYGLPLFASGNKPTWNDEWNPTMRNIDSTLKSLNTINQSQDGDIESLKSRVTTTENNIINIDNKIKDVNLLNSTGNSKTNIKYLGKLKSTAITINVLNKGRIRFFTTDGTVPSCTRKQFYSSAGGSGNILYIIKNNDDFLKINKSDLIVTPTRYNLFVKSYIVGGVIEIPFGTSDLRYINIVNNNFLIPFDGNGMEDTTFNTYVKEYTDTYGIQILPLCFKGDMIITDSDTVIPENFFNGYSDYNGAYINLNVSAFVYQAI